MNKKTKKLIIDIGVSAVLAAVNILLWYIGQKSGEQIYWIAFVLVWFNIALAWLTRVRQKPISYIFLSTSLIVEILVLINIYWISTRVM